MAELKAIFFDQDGVIIDTEKDGHRVAFNQAFKEFGYDFDWGVELYHELLQVPGGKERIRHFLKNHDDFSGMTLQELDELIKKLHARKTEIFISLIQSQKLPLRSGVRRFMGEAQGLGIVMGVCTTANEKSAAAVRAQLPEIDFAFVLAGDVVSRKKPDPEIYNMAVAKTGLPMESCLVVEDSEKGVEAATQAGLMVVATTNLYTEQEDLSKADIVVTRLGDPDGEKGKLIRSKHPFEFDGVLKVEQLKEYFRARPAVKGRRKVRV